MLKKYYLYLLVYTVPCWPLATVNTLARRLLSLPTQTLSKLELRKTQIRLLRALKKTKPEQFQKKPWLLHNTTKALLISSPFMYFKQYGPTLLVSFDLFEKTPGYIDTLHRIVSNANKRHLVTGHGYEFLKAVCIELNPNDEHVVSFNQQITHEGLRPRRMDIITTHRWIECKNCQFAPAYIEAFKQQFHEQHCLFNAHNKKNHGNLSYEIHTYQSMPDKLKTWCHSQGIPVVCTQN